MTDIWKTHTHKIHGKMTISLTPNLSTLFSGTITHRLTVQSRSQQIEVSIIFYYIERKGNTYFIPSYNLVCVSNSFL